jgi:hypothetical protein
MLAKLADQLEPEGETHGEDRHTMNALIKRSNRKLAPEYEAVRKARGERRDLGAYYAVDTFRNMVLNTHVDPEARARELGVMRGLRAIRTGGMTMAGLLVNVVVAVTTGVISSWMVAWLFYRKSKKDADESLLILARFLERFAGEILPPEKKMKLGFSRDSGGRISNAQVSIQLEAAAFPFTAGPVRMQTDKPPGETQGDKER